MIKNIKNMFDKIWESYENCVMRFFENNLIMSVVLPLSIAINVSVLIAICLEIKGV